MKYLILINSAPNYFYFYNELAKELVRNGHVVYYAVNSHLPEVVYNFEKTDFKVFYFSDFLKENYHTAILPDKYTKYNLWEMFFSDFERYEIYGHHLKDEKEVYPKIIINLFCFFEEVLKTMNIDHIIYEDISNSFAYSAFIVSKELKRNYIGISCSRLPKRFEIVSSIEGSKAAIKQNYELIIGGLIDVPTEIENEVRKYLDNFIFHKPDYMVNNSLSSDYNFFSRYINVQRFKFYCRLIKYRIKYIYDNRYNYQVPTFSVNFAYFKRNLKRKIKLSFIWKYFNEFNPINPYYFYPIQFHPEASTSVLAKSFVDEYNNILNISLNIPFGEYLYVKDHESSVGYPSLNFYKKVSRIPNVILISHKFNAKEIIRNSKAIITITSTVGFEAIVLNKPVFVFGNVFYDFHPLCTKVLSFDSLFEMLLNLNFPKQYDPSAFLKAYYLVTYPGELKYIENLGDNELKVVKKIANVIGFYEN